MRGQMRAAMCGQILKHQKEPQGETFWDFFPHIVGEDIMTNFDASVTNSKIIQIGLYPSMRIGSCAWIQT